MERDSRSISESVRQRERRFIYLVIAVSAIIGFGYSSASAQVINGCIKGNGTLKFVTDPAAARTGRRRSRG
jgi:hypothetical protein